MSDQYGGGPNYFNAEKLENRISRLKIINFILFIVRLLAAILTIVICFWIRFDLDFREWVWETDWYTYWYCMYVILFAMIIELFISISGITGVLTERLGYLTFCVWGMGLMFFWEMAGAIVIIIYGMEESPVLIAQLHDVFLGLVYKWDVDPRASRILRQIQEYVGCCGADGSDDYIKALKPLPVECRDLITGNEYAYGCQQQFAWWLEPWTSILAASCFFFMLTSIFGIVTSRMLKRNIITYNRSMDY